MIEKVNKYTTNANDIFEHVIKEDSFELNHVVIEPGKFFPKHPTDADVSIIIVRGELSITLGNQDKKHYYKGTVLSVEKGIDSILGNGSKEPLELFVIKRK